MSTHVVKGDVSVAVGTYTAGTETKHKYRKIGTLMETTNDDGSKREWIRFNAEIFQAGLFALASAAGRAKGEDTIIGKIFEQREKPSAPTPDSEKTGDDIPF